MDIQSMVHLHKEMGLLGGSMVENLPASAGDLGSIPGSERASAGGNGNPLQYSCLRNLTDRGAWWATVHGVVEKSDTTEQLTTARRILLRICHVPCTLHLESCVVLTP